MISGSANSRARVQIPHFPPSLSFVALYPTPRANKWGPPDSHGKVPEALAGGRLNPRWVEWLMGIPIGWTRLEPLEMESRSPAVVAEFLRGRR